MNKRFFNVYAVLAVLIAAALADVNAAEPTPQQAPTPSFLGFELGEEVRYVLERADGERRGMLNHWSLSLEEINGDVGVFDLTYDVGTFSNGGGGTIMARHQARAWINTDGFPTRVHFLAQRNTPYGVLQYTIDYTYDQEEGRFIKVLESTGDDQEAKLGDYAIVDATRPAGLYLFYPIDGECMAMASELRAAGGSGSQAQSNPSGGIFGSNPNGTRADYEQPCDGREPLFANPGLLNLTMPALWEAGTGALEFLAMAPTGVIPRALMGGGQPGGSTSFSIGGYSPFGSKGPYPFEDADDAFLMFSIKSAGDLMQLEVGGRQVDVWKMEAGAPLDAVYVDGNGSIVRLDLPADVETGERFWIRRLRPSEY